MKLSARFQARQVAKSLARVRKRVPPVTAQILNRQAAQSRTKITRGTAQQTGVRPQKRIRRRVLVPRSGRARPQRLEAVGLALLESFPRRYFPKGTTGGARTTIQPAGTVDRKGRRTVGRHFEARMPSGHVGRFRRTSRSRARRRADGQATALPVVPVEVVSLEAPGRAVRARVLADLAKAFPPEWERRMRRETRRAFG